MCRNGTVEVGEACDDGNSAPNDGCSFACAIEATWSCVGSPSVCNRCGSGALEGAEVCDGANLQGQTCLSRGYRRGTGSLACAANCLAYNTAGCGPAITLDHTSVNGALADAFAQAGHEVVALPPGVYAIGSNSITFNETGTPAGVTLQPLSGVVEIRGTAYTGALRVLSGNNIIQGLTIDAPRALSLELGANAGNNFIRNNFIVNVATDVFESVYVLSDGNTIEANRFENLHASFYGYNAIWVNGGENNTISMNVIYGPYSTLTWGGAIMVNDANAGTTYIDHNSIWVRNVNNSSTDQNIGIVLSTVTNLCMRNNIVIGDNASIGYRLVSPVSNATAATCGDGRATSENVNLTHLTACSSTPGSLCTNLCTNAPRTFCDTTTSPAFADSRLCLPAANALVNFGWDLGYDMWDNNVATFNGSAPEVGARELGTSRVYGGTSSACP